MRAAKAGKGGMGGGLPCPFLKIEKTCPDFGKKVLRVSRGKSSKILPCGGSKVYQSTLTPKNLPCPKKLLVARLINYMFIKQYHSTHCQ